MSKLKKTPAENKARQAKDRDRLIMKANRKVRRNVKGGSHKHLQFILAFILAASVLVLAAMIAVLR